MSNRVAIVLGLTLIALICIDVLVFGTEHLIFLGKKFIALIDHLAFWR